MRRVRVLKALLTAAVIVGGGAMSVEQSFAAGSATIESGRAKLKSGDVDGAMAISNQLITADEQNFHAHLLRANCYFKQENYKQAMGDLDKVVQLAPNNVRALLMRGTAHARLSEDDAAVADFTAAIKQDDSLGKRYFANGGAAEVQREGKAAKRDAQGAVHEGLNLHAIKDYQQAINAVYPNGMPSVQNAPAMTVDGRSVAIVEKGSKSGKSHAGQSAAQADSVIDVTAPGAGAFEGDAKAAVANLTELIRNNPNDPNTYYKRGKAQQKLARPDEALSDFAAAINLDPQKSQYYIARASVYYQLGKANLMEAEIKHARSVDPEVPAHVHFDLPAYPAKTKWSGN